MEGLEIFGTRLGCKVALCMVMSFSKSIHFVHIALNVATKNFWGLS